MDASGKVGDARSAKEASTPRELLGNPGALVAARERTMSERLELALSWNAVAAELRAGLAQASPSSPDQR